MEGRSISEDALRCERERVCLTFMATARVALASFSFSFLGATTRATLGRCKYRVNGSQHNSSKSRYPLHVENFMGQCALLVITNSSASYLLQSYVSFQRQIVGMWSLLPEHKLLQEHIVTLFPSWSNAISSFATCRYYASGTESYPLPDYKE